MWIKLITFVRNDDESVDYSTRSYDVYYSRTQMTVVVYRQNFNHRLSLRK